MRGKGTEVPTTNLSVSLRNVQKTKEELPTRKGETTQRGYDSMVDGKRILIVDDEYKVAFFLQESLRGLGGYEVMRAETAERALQVCQEQSFDLVVTDFRLPGINGLELMRQLRAIRPAIRTILITAYGSDEIEAEAYALQARGYLTKPFHIEEFVRVVQAALETAE